MKYVAFFLLIFFLTSCLGTHTPATHCTPDFKNKNELVIASSAGFSGFSANIAYTPVKYFGIVCNGHDFGGTATNGYHKYGDFGLLGYLPTKKRTYGLMIGYGLGSFDWSNAFSGEGGTLSFTKGKYQKMYALGYTVFNYRYFDLVPSVKIGNVSTHWDFHKYSGDYPVSTYDNYSNTLYVEGFFNIKIKPVKWFRITTGFGFYAQNDALATTSPGVFRFGLEFDLFKKNKIIKDTVTIK